MAVMATTRTAGDLVLDTALVKKYDGYGPRYTSYPTQPLSLYVHLPFCNTICFYCACNKVITKDHGRSAKYIRYLGREIGIVGGMIEGAPRVEQLHWGGGTPTFLARDEMATRTRSRSSAGKDSTASRSASRTSIPPCKRR